MQITCVNLDAMKDNPLVLIDKAVEYYGGQAELAKFLDISSPAISNMRARGDIYLPPRRALEVLRNAPQLEEKPKQKKKQ